MTVKFDFARLDQPFEADWPVLVQVPQDGGTVAEEQFMARLRMLSADELKSADKTDDPGRAVPRMAMIGFGKGEEQTFSPELLEKMMDVGYVRIALNRAYGQFSVGVAAKN